MDRYLVIQKQDSEPERGRQQGNSCSSLTTLGHEEENNDHVVPVPRLSARDYARLLQAGRVGSA